jgi:uncharacterized phage-associated protein
MFRRILNHKIGNILIYIAEQSSPLYMTKGLKLLYLIDEQSVRLSGSPITWLDYKVWKNGPVAEELYQELRYNQVLTFGEQRISLNNFLDIEHRTNHKNKEQIDVKLIPKQASDFSQFSDFEIKIIKLIVEKYGNLTSTQLIDTLHQQGTRWHEIVEQHNLEAHFSLRGNTSDYTIDFIDLIEDDEMLSSSARASFEALSFQENLLNLNPA